MNRKTFIWASVVLAAGAGVPVIIRRIHHNALLSRPLMYPSFLARFMEEVVIKKIGIAYRLMNYAENKQKRLEQLILADVKNKYPPANDGFELSEQLEKETLRNFKANETVIADGWVLSVTEARQCALFSFTH